MWNRQREAEAARERLAQVDDDKEAPNRMPPPVEDTSATEKPGEESDVIPTAAE
jgi:ATP-binding cassette subfamily B protein